MLNIKLILLLASISFGYQASHCLNSYKICNLYSQPMVSHCKLGYSNMCLECENNYSLSADKTKCVNVANCKLFDSDGKCSLCNDYYNFDSDGNCVRDNCQYYNDDDKTKCYLCYLRFRLNNEFKCEKNKY